MQLVALYVNLDEANRAIWQMSVEKLGDIPFGGALGEAAQNGVPITIGAPDSVAARAFADIAQEVVTRLS